MIYLNKYIGRNTFRIGLGYTRAGTFEHNHDILMDRSYFNVTFFNTEYIYSKETGQQRIPHYIPLDRCNDSFSGLVDDDLIDRFGLKTHLCPAMDDFYLVGDLNSMVYRDIEILVTPCNENNNEGITWRPREEIELAITTGFINAPITISYFDLDDYENPLKTLLTEPDDHYLNPNFTTWIEYFVRENTALTSDNIFYNEPFKETKFYDIGTQNIKTTNQVITGGAILFITIGNFAQTIQFERTVYSLLDLFGYLGGLYDFMLIIGFVFINGFQDKLYQNLISSSIYQVKSTAKTDDTIMDVNSSIIEESKSNLQTFTSVFNSRRSPLRKLSWSRITPKNKQTRLSRANSGLNDPQTF